jgi:large subunit ribosomal protein L29
MAKAKKTYREMPDDELSKELDGLLKGLFNLRVRKVTDVVENPAAFRQHRREIARIKTEMRARQLKKAARPAGKPAPKGVASKAEGSAPTPGSAPESKAQA